MMHHGELETAFALLTAGNSASARSIIMKVLNDDPKNKRGLLLLSDIDQADGNSEQALEICRTLIALYPDDEEVRSDLVYKLAKMSKHEEARTALENFVRDFPHSTQITYLRTIASMNRDDVSTFKSNIVKLRAEYGDTLLVNLLEGCLAEAEGSNTDAFNSATRAMMLEPTNSDAHSIAARAAFRLF